MICFMVSVQWVTRGHGCARCVGDLRAGAEREVSPASDGPMGFMMVSVFSLELVESLGLGLMGVPGGPPPPGGPV